METVLVIIILFVCVLFVIGFYTAEFVHSKFLNSTVLKCPSKTNPGKFYLFTKMKVSKSGERTYYACSGCRKIQKRGTVARVIVSWQNKELKAGTVISDPDINHVAGCMPMSAESFGKRVGETSFCVKTMT